MNGDQFKSTLAASCLGVFRTWLHVGKLAVDLPDAAPPVYKTLGQFVSAHAVQSPGWEKTLVRDFLAAPSADGTVRDTLRTFLARSVPWLVNTAFELADPATVADRESMQSTCDQFLAGAGATQLVDALMTTFDAEMGDLILMDTFLRRRETVGFASWSQYNSERLEGTQEVSRQEVDGLGSPKLFLDVDEHDDLDAPVEAGEWVGGAKDPADGQWRSVAAGMVYRFLPRARKRAQNLLDAADSVSGGDFERAVTFLESYPAAAGILQAGDIAFVWEWERRHGTEPGEGVACLAAICGQLRAQYPQLRSIVFSVSPQRFTPRAAGEPSLITEARLSDLDKLQAYIAGLQERLGLDVYVVGSDANEVSQEPGLAYT